MSVHDAPGPRRREIQDPLHSEASALELLRRTHRASSHHDSLPLERWALGLTLDELVGARWRSNPVVRIAKGMHTRFFDVEAGAE